jgi:hypothetical protein
MGELLIVAESVEDTDKLANRSDPRPGFHFVRITGAITNVGKHALCADVSATLETTFNLQSYATVYLAGRLTGRIYQLLPGEQVHADFEFDAKDGVQPLTLVVKQMGKRQGCSNKEPLPTANPQVRFSVTNIENVSQQEMSR